MKKLLKSKSFIISSLLIVIILLSFLLAKNISQTYSYVCYNPGFEFSSENDAEVTAQIHNLQYYEQLLPVPFRYGYNFTGWVIIELDYH